MERSWKNQHFEMLFKPNRNLRTTKVLINDKGLNCLPCNTTIPNCFIYNNNKNQSNELLLTDNRRKLLKLSHKSYPNIYSICLFSFCEGWLKKSKGFWTLIKATSVSKWNWVDWNVNFLVQAWMLRVLLKFFKKPAKIEWSRPSYDALEHRSSKSAEKIECALCTGQTM